jgi:hypothetical protein
MEGQIMNRLAMTAILLMLATGNSPSQGTPYPPVVTHNGFFRAQDYLGMNPGEQRMYVAGVLDGFYNAPMFGAPDNNELLIRIATCVEGMKTSQVGAIVLKYTNDHPEKWALHRFECRDSTPLRS